MHGLQKNIENILSFEARFFKGDTRSKEDGKIWTPLEQAESFQRGAFANILDLPLTCLQKCVIFSVCFKAGGGQRIIPPGRIYEKEWEKDDGVQGG